jgi:hypothetical protein
MPGCMPEWMRKKREFRKAKARTMAGPMAILERFERKLRAEARAAVRKRSRHLPSEDIVTMEMYKMLNHTRKDELEDRMRRMFSRRRRK